MVLCNLRDDSRLLPSLSYCKAVAATRLDADKWAEMSIFHPVPDNHPSGTPGSCFAVRIVNDVFTLATLGAGVSFDVKNS